jgi:selenocysteine lyase/cysteine desulfurase
MGEHAVIPSDEQFWTERRREMILDPNSVNLNAGTLSPVPRPVFDAVIDLRRRQAAAPSDFCWRQTPPLINRARTSLANYLHCREADLLLLPNRTHGFGNEAYMVRRRWDYFVRNLLGAEPPKEYQIGAGR